MFWGMARTSPEARERYLRWSFYSSCVAGFIYLGLALWTTLADRRPRIERRAAFIVYCESQGDAVEACEARLEANHDDCYGVSGGGFGAGRRTRSGVIPFDAERYQSCTYMGLAAWKEARFAARKQASDRRRAEFE